MNIKNKLMLFCMGVLVLALLTIGVRFAARQVLVKKLNMDNIVTQTIFFDNQELQKNRKEPVDDDGGIPIDWEKQYPFDQLNANKSTNKDIDEKGFKKKITDWATSNFLLYDHVVEFGMNFERMLWFSLLQVADERVQQLNDGYYIFTYSRSNMTERADSVAEFAKFAKENNARICYINLPAKTNKYADKEVKGINYTNDNADELLKKLKERGIDTLDLRDNIKTLTPSEYHALFFRTDHHWKPSTGLWAAGIVADKLKTMGITVDKTHLSLADYKEKIYPKGFMGSQGEKIKLSDEFSEDISLYYPNFPTKFHIKVPDYQVDENGDFSVLYNKKLIAKAEKTGKLSYSVYRYGSTDFCRIDNLNLTDEAEVLIIADSFSTSMGVFLATSVAHITFLDIRRFNGSVQKVVKKLKPSAILIMHTPHTKKNIKWDKHTDEFDFR